MEGFSRNVDEVGKKMPSVNQIPNGKTQINAIISTDIYKQLISIAPQVYGKGRGGISYVIEEALKLYLQTFQAHTNAQNGGMQGIQINPTFSVREEYKIFLNELRKIYWEITDSYDIPPIVKRGLVESAIARAFKRAKDERTRFRKLHTWFLNGLIKPIYPNIIPYEPKDWKKIQKIELVAKDT